MALCLEGGNSGALEATDCSCHRALCIFTAGLFIAAIHRLDLAKGLKALCPYIHQWAGFLKSNPISLDCSAERGWIPAVLGQPKIIPTRTDP